MSDARGTLEAAFRQVATILSPLEGLLTPDRAPALFAELGIPLPPSRAPVIAAQCGAVSNGVGHLMRLGAELEAAVRSGEAARIAEKSAAALAKLAEVIRSLVLLADALRDPGLGVAPAELGAVPGRLFSYLVVRYLGRTPGLNEVLELTGVLERVDHNVDAADADHPFYTTNEFHLERIGGWLSDPAGRLAELYDWGTPAFDGRRLLPKLEAVLGTLGVPALYFEQDGIGALDLGLVELRPVGAAPRGLAVVLKQNATRFETAFTGPDWRITLGLEAGILAGSELAISSDGVISLRVPDRTTTAGRAHVTYEARRDDPNDPFMLFGQAGGSRLTVRGFAASVEAGVRWLGDHAEGQFGVGGELTGGKVVIEGGQGDGFLRSILSGFRLENTFDLGFSYTTDAGLHFHGSSSLSIRLASHVSLGPIELRGLTLSVGLGEGEFPVTLASDIRAALGPLTALVEGMGLEARVRLVGADEGNLGFVDLRPGFKPPRGVGLAVEAGAVRGGGYLFFDFENGEYAGVLQLDIAGLVTARAVGLITTRLPDGREGFSLLLIITAEFSPPLQLGMGFTLSGLGGLLGLNRTVLLGPLREGVRTGAINSLLFPVNVVANAPRIISDLRTIFPPREGAFLIAPMAKLGWGSPPLVTLSFGLIIEIPGNIAIIGVLRLALPDASRPLLNIQVSFVGTLDFGRKLLTFDATLFDSRLLFISLSGDMAVRLTWGAEPSFLLSVGGFHPSFQPPPLELPPMARLTLSILDTDSARLRAEAYFAVTSNTVQLGCRVEIYFGFSAFHLDGHFGFDALVRFSPFYFTAELTAGLALHLGGLDLLSIRVQLAFEGPTPWHARGTGSIAVLFFEVSASFDVTWGESADTTLPPVEVLPLVLADLRKPENWKALPPPSSRPWVSLRAIEEGADTLVLQPAGVLQVTQKVAPLDFTLERVGSQMPSDVKRVGVSAARGGGNELRVAAVDDMFARAQFQAMTDAEKLSVRSFEPLHAGVALSAGASLAAGRPVTRALEYEVQVIDRGPRPPGRRGLKALAAGLFTHLIKGTAAARSKPSHGRAKELKPHDDQPEARPEGFTVAHLRDGSPFDEHLRFTSEAAARGHLADLVLSNPALRERLHVLPEFEVNRP